MRAPYQEYQAVEEAAMQFVKSVAEGNSQYARELFTDEAVLFGYLDGKLEHGSIEQFYHNVDTVAAGENFKARVDVLLLEETLAVVRVLEEGWGGISYKTLSATLKELEADQLVHREEYPQIPPKVEYSLTERGKSLIPILDNLCQWGDDHRL